MELHLDDIETRVLGCLIEKELTTPDYYPLTLNSLVTACNQKSNRHPVVEFEDTTVIRALDSLKIKSIIMSVHPQGSRSVKYKHIAKEKLDWLDDEIAVLCELFIRGPQTVGELRNRCERLYQFESLDDVRDTLTRLSKRMQPLVMELPRQVGKKEPRWAHLLSGEPELPSEDEQLAAVEPARLKIARDDERIDALEAEVADLKEQIAGLTAQFEQFKSQFE